MRLLDNIKNFKSNYQKVKASPYSSLIMKYKINRAMFYFMCFVIGWRVVKTIINFTDVTALINSIIIIVLGCWFLLSLHTNKIKIKQHLEFYENNGKDTQGYYDTTVNVKAEIDDLLNKLKENQKNDGTTENNKER